MHELGHSFGCEHTPAGIMARGFDHFNRFFCISQPGQRAPIIGHAEEQGAFWEESSIAVIMKHPLYKVGECVFNESGSRPRPTAPIKITSNSQVKVISATYGPADVSATFAAVLNGSKYFTANNSTFSDTMPGWCKSFTAVLQSQTSNDYYMIIASEGQDICISEDMIHVPAHNTEGKYNIIAAAYGLIDVTDVCRSIVDEYGDSTINVNNGEFEDGWPNMKKTFTIVYEQDGRIQTKFTEEGQSVSL